MNVALIVLDGRHCGRKIRLPRTQFVIGRDPKCHLRPASRRVSRFHCALARRGRDLLVRDLRSQNGTFVNGRRLEGTLRLHHGDVLQAGTLRFQVEIDDTAERRFMPDSGLHWLFDEQQTGAQGSLVPTSETAFGLDAYDDSGAPSGMSGRPSNSDTLIAGDYLQHHAARSAPKR